MNERRRVVPVILSGGNGTRLWPMSRQMFPKQLLPLLSEVSMLQQTAWRVRGPQFAEPLLICGEDHRFVVDEQLRSLGIHPRQIVLEPAPRNTAPALAVAALLLADDPDALMLVCPADHAIDDVDGFRRTVELAADVADQGRLVTFGITATSAETGYGWIQSGDRLLGLTGASEVATFVEKPERAVAEAMFDSGAWSWNSGMFMFPPALLLEELGKRQPDVVAAASAAVDSARPDLAFLRLGSQLGTSPSISIDHAVMEHTDKAAVVRARFGWSDVGSWSALWTLAERDADDNVLLGDVIARGTSGCYIRSEDRLVAAVGLQDAVVVATKDAVLVADRSACQDVKEVVDLLNARGRDETAAHTVVYRPWGYYEAVDSGPGYQVKHIAVKPGQQLSLQKHAYRAEHWVVISGTAEVVRGDDVLTLTDRMSIDVPVGCVHRLSNPGHDELLHLIEVQTGPYLGEDDIIRLEDAYGRDASSSAPQPA